jgi:hypothetical protein
MLPAAAARRGAAGEIAATLAAWDVKEINCLAVNLHLVAPIGYWMRVTLGIPVALKASGIACALPQKRPAASGVLASLVALSFSRPSAGGGAVVGVVVGFLLIGFCVYFFGGGGGGVRVNVE